VRARERIALALGVCACREGGGDRASAHSRCDGFVERDQQFSIEIERF
jgi:hypothetical protein